LSDGDLRVDAAFFFLELLLFIADSMAKLFLLKPRDVSEGWFDSELVGRAGRLLFLELFLFIAGSTNFSSSTSLSSKIARGLLADLFLLDITG
jgi:hypothetical protein